MLMLVATSLRQACRVASGKLFSRRHSSGLLLQAACCPFGEGNCLQQLPNWAALQQAGLERMQLATSAPMKRGFLNHSCGCIVALDQLDTVSQTAC
jgi:hypothetical protein